MHIINTGAIEMSHFSEYITQIIKSKKLTIYSLSAKTGIERSLLTKAFNGTRKLNIENFLKIIPVLNLTPEAEIKLRNEYIYSNIGKDSYYSYIKLLTLLCHNKSEKVISNDTPRINFSLEFPTASIKINNKRDLLNTIEFVINSEKNSSVDKKRIYTNITLPDFYDIMTNYPLKEMGNLDFKRIILLNNHSKSESVDILFETIKFMKLGYFTNFILTDYSLSRYPDIIFPFYLITSEYSVFMDHSFEHGYVINDKFQTDIHADGFTNIAQKSICYAVRYQNILEEKEAIFNLFKNGVEHFYYIGRNVSPMFCDCQIWESIAKPNLNDRAFLIKTVNTHYSFISQSTKSFTHIYFKSSLEDFVDNGILHEIPSEYITPLSIQERLKVLYALKERIINSNDEFYLIRNNTFGPEVTDCFCIYYNTQNDKQCCLSIGVNDGSDKTTYSGNFTCNIYEKSTVLNAVNFIKHMVISSSCYSQRESLLILDEQIERCELKFETL